VLGAALTIVWATNGESQAQPALEGDRAFIVQRMLKQMGVDPRTGHGIRSIAGDSGGPNFQTYTAVGTTTGCVTNDPNGCGGPYNPAYFYDAHVARIQSQLSNSIGYYLYTGSGK
jgi:hypothetical protein